MLGRVPSFQQTRDNVEAVMVDSAPLPANVKRIVVSFTWKDQGLPSLPFPVAAASQAIIRIGHQGSRLTALALIFNLLCMAQWTNAFKGSSPLVILTPCRRCCPGPCLTVSLSFSHHLFDHLFHRLRSLRQ